MVLSALSGCTLKKDDSLNAQAPDNSYRINGTDICFSDNFIKTSATHHKILRNQINCNQYNSSSISLYTPTSTKSILINGYELYRQDKAYSVTTKKIGDNNYIESVSVESSPVEISEILGRYYRPTTKQCYSLIYGEYWDLKCIPPAWLN